LGHNSRIPHPNSWDCSRKLWRKDH